MGFLNILGKIGKIAAPLVAAPFTGGASLTALLPTIAGAGIDAAGMIAGNHAISKGQQAQQQALNQALAAQQQGYNTAQGALNTNNANAIQSLQQGQQNAAATQQPYAAAGQQGLMSLGQMLQNGNDVNFNFDPSQVQADPGFQFRMDEAMKALSRSAAGRGLLGAGGTLKQLTQYGQNLASQEYGNAYNRAFQNSMAQYNAATANRQNRQGLATTLLNSGQNAANNLMSLNQMTGQNIAAYQNQLGQNLANLATGNAQSMGNIYSGLGNVNAAASIAKANNLNQGLGNIAQGVMSLGGVRVKKPESFSY